MGELPEAWKQIKFNEDGFAVFKEGEGEQFWSLEETQPLEDRVLGIIDEPTGRFINAQGEAVEVTDAEMEKSRRAVMFGVEFTVPYPAAVRSMVWKPTAVCVDGGFFVAYSDETGQMLEASPRISKPEASLLADLLSKIFTYDPAKRLRAEELVEHPWFRPVPCPEAITNR